MPMSIPGKERYAGNIWEVEKMRLLNRWAIIVPGLDSSEEEVEGHAVTYILSYNTNI